LADGQLPHFPWGRTACFPHSAVNLLVLKVVPLPVSADFDVSFVDIDGTRRCVRDEQGDEAPPLPSDRTFYRLVSRGERY
jgi:hypothetical protein